MDYVIDIQGLYDRDDTFIAKEVAVLSIDKSYIGHWITAPTLNYLDLPSTVRNKNNWTTRFHHGLEWFEGDVPLRTLHANLREIARSAGIIYTRGREKAKYLQNVTAREIKNLEEVECPSFRNLPPSEHVCWNHGLWKSPKFFCALNNAAKLKNWIVTDVSSPRCYSSVLARDEYDPDQPGITGFTLECVEKRLRCRSDTEGVDETDSSCFEY